MAKIVYQTNDGKIFDTHEEAVEHETEQTTKAEKLYQNYLKTWNGEHLLKDHNLDEEGTWEVKGEDSNPDLGGSHYEPTLGVFEGKLDDIIKHAVALPNFWNWGAGGSIKKVEVRKIQKIG